jgi:hypothetical protein
LTFLTLMISYLRLRHLKLHNVDLELARVFGFFR